MKVHAGNARPGYRVSVDGRGMKETTSLESACKRAQELAAHGTYCIVEQRRNTGALWTLVSVYTPLGRGRYSVVNPHAPDDTPVIVG